MGVHSRPEHINSRKVAILTQADYILQKVVPTCSYPSVQLVCHFIFSFAFS